MHRSSSKSKTLKLQRETVRTLVSSELSAAQGGGTIVQVTQTPGICTIQPPVDFTGAGPISNGPDGCPQFPGHTSLVNPRPILFP